MMVEAVVRDGHGGPEAIRDVPDGVVALRQRLQALTVAGIPYSTAKRLTTMECQQKNFVRDRKGAYIRPSRAQETIRVASLLKCTAVT
jgi:hypothetical protein